MATAFPDVKPWPKQAEPNERVALGNNQPPLEESIVLDFEEALRGREGLIDRIKAMEERAAAIEAEAKTLAEAGDKLGPCKTAERAGRFGDFIKMTSTAAKMVEEERETLNRPLLTAQRSLKAKADSYSQRALAAGSKIRGYLDTFLAEEDKKRRAEEARLAEVARQAEAARQAVIDEANRKAAAEAETERQRLQAIEDARAATEAREAVVVEVAPEPVFVAEPAPVFVSAPASRGPLRGDYGTAVSAVETWHVKVENIRQVPDQFLRHPSVVEALEKVLGTMVRGKNGMREIKGCRIFSTVGSSVR